MDAVGHELEHELEAAIYGIIKHGYPEEDGKNYQLYMDFYHEFLGDDSYLSKLIAKGILESGVFEIKSKIY